MHFFDMLLKKPSTFKILKVLLSNPYDEMTKYSIRKHSGVEHVDGALKLLVSLNLVVKVSYGGISKYRANLSDERVKAIMKFFTEIKYLSTL